MRRRNSVLEELRNLMNDTRDASTPSTHPQADELQARLAKVIAPATHAADVRVIVQILGDHRGLGTPKGEERVRLVTRLYAALTDMRIRVDIEDLLGAFGAGRWEPQ